MRESFGLIPVAVAFLAALILWIVARRMTRHLEVQADKIARTQEESPGDYARALEKIYEANLVPVVLSRHSTHPDLYDRLVAAGVEPSYKRPAPPSRFRSLLSAGVAATVAVLLLSAAIIGRALLFTDRDSEQALLMSMALDGGSAGDLSDLALLRFRQNDYEGSVVFYRAATATNQDSVYDPANLAIVLVRMDRCQEAATAVAEAESRLARNSHPRSDEVTIAASARNAVMDCQSRQSKQKR
jgi:hypothetical protein